MPDPKAKHPAEPKRVLGRGLDALLPAVTAAAASRLGTEYQRVPIEQVRAQRGQPRKRFDEDELAQLTASISAQGLIQPIVVRRVADGFEIIAGERRWRAARRAEMTEIPVVIKDVDPVDAFELALIENIQRTDLDPLETAEAYQRLIDEHGYTQDALADRVGKSRVAVANTLRLLTLPESVRAHVVAGRLTEGHARALLAARDPRAVVTLADRAVEHSWSVRQTERAARETVTKPSGARRPEDTNQSANARDLQRRVAEGLGMRVSLRETVRGKAGVLAIEYDSLAQLDVLIERLLPDRDV